MNKRQRKKQAKKQAIKTGVYRPRNTFRSSMSIKTGAYTPRNTFRSTMSIQTTLFNPNIPKNKKMISLAERNLNRLAFVITKPNIVNLTNLTEDDVKFLQGAKFTHDVENLYQYFEYNRDHYRDPKRIDNIVRKVMTKYFYNRNISSTQALDNALRRLTRQLDDITRKHEKKSKDRRRFNNPFVIVYYSQMELR